MNTNSNTDHGRVHSLDGLRGIACLAVLLYHVGVMVQPFGPSDAYSLLPGTAAVMVFYVLSGVVLSLAPLKKLHSISTTEADGVEPAQRTAGYDWFAYYPRRIVRLCIPLFVAIALGVIAGFVAQSMGSASRSAVAVDYSAEPRFIVHDILMQFDILFNVSDGFYTLYGEPLTRVDSPVWSMSWELWFSILLPACIFIALLIKRARIAAIVLIACIFIAHFTGYFPLRFAIMFLIGVFIAKSYATLSKGRPPLVLEAIALITCLLLIELPYLCSGEPLLDACANTIMNGACAALVLLALSDGFVRRALSTRPCRWLGKVSYSMYLTHAIVVGGLQAVLSQLNLPSPAIALIALIASFVVAWLFWYFVERPSITWSHKIGKLAASAEVAD